MPQFRKTAQAENDLIEIWLTIAQDNPAAADRLLDSIEEKGKLIAAHPQLGQARPDIAEEYRHFPVESYLMLYREQADGIELVRVVHGRRLLDDL